MIKQCEGCGSEFRVRPSASHYRFCSVPCRRLLRVTKTCQVCGGCFDVTSSKTHYKHCSQACRDIEYKLTRIDKVCVNCGASFSILKALTQTNCCSESCRNENMRKINLATLHERFWSRVDTSGDCWLWNASLNRNGYGYICVNGKVRSSHRLSYEWSYGPTPAGLCVCHACDNPRCVRPDHLFLGTNDDNMADMVAKGRQAKGDRNGSRLHPDRRARGERSAGAKLTEKSVREIRQMYVCQKFGATRIAKMFGVSKSTVQKVIRGKAWAHVAPETYGAALDAALKETA